MSNYIHPQALVDEGATIGEGTRVWAFAHICEGAIVGNDCNICDHTFIEKNVIVGNRVTIKCGVFLWDGLVVEDDVFIGPCATFTNDLQPRRRQCFRAVNTILQQGCSIGANATVLPGLTIGRWSMVAAGAFVTKNVPNHALVIGSPASLKAWVCRCGNKLSEGESPAIGCTCGRKYHFLENRQLAEVTQ